MRLFWPQMTLTDNSGIDLVVVVPVARMDWHLAIKLLRWMSRLDDFYGTIVVYVSPAFTVAERLRLSEACPGCLVVIAEKVIEKGYFGSPNQMIHGALEYTEKHYPGRAMLWVEADCVPMRASWLKEITDEYRACGKPFMGDFITAGQTIPHLTGNAVYHPEWRKYAPSLANLPNMDPTWGWDSQCAHETFAQAHHSTTIEQIWRLGPFIKSFGIGGINPATALFHQCKDGTLIDVLCDKLGIPEIPLDEQLEKCSYDRDLASGVKSGPQPVNLNRMQYVGGPATAPVTEIMIVTCARDLEFLKYCLLSIEKNAKGFSGVTLVVPRAEEAIFKKAPKIAKVCYYDEIPGKGMLHHEVQICRADEWCPNAEAVLHVDADCMFWQHCTPLDYAPGGKPMIVRERYSAIGARNPNRLLWRDCVAKAIGLVPEWECMTRHPAIHWRETYRKTREMVEKFTHRNFDEFVLDGQNAFPQSFCEFNTLGAVAIRHFSDRYTMVDYDHARDGEECGIPEGTPYQYIYRRDRDRLVECWSHAGVSQYKTHMDAWLAGRVPAYQLK